MTPLTPCYLHIPHVDHVRQAADPTDPKTWEVGDWIEVGGVVAAGAAWIWRHTIKAWFLWLGDWFSMPRRVREITAGLATAMYNAEGAIARARATWDTLTEVPVWESDALGNCVHCNKTMLRVLQRQTTEILGDNWRQIIHQPDRPLVYGEWDSCIRDGRDFDLTYHWVRSDGHLIKIHANANRILSSSGEIIGWVSFVTLVK